MKQGLTLPELGREVLRQAETKRDFVADTSALTMAAAWPEPKGMALVVANNEPVGIRDIAHRQLGEHVGIPAKYYDRMRSASPDLLAANVNHWLHAETGVRRMVRTLDGQARAILSDRFRRLDNFDIVKAVVPFLVEAGVQILSAEITETKLYIKGVDKRILSDLRPGTALGRGHDRFDTLSPAIVISNSEVGMGSLAFEAGVWTHGCTNLLVVQQHSMRKYHIGAKAELGDAVYAMLSDETRNLTDQALWAQARDVVKGAFEQARFDATVAEMAKTTEDRVTGNPTKAVEVVANHFQMTEEEKGTFMRHFIEGGDLTRYGVLNAVTRTAEDLPSYDRASEFEKMGGAVIALTPSEWKEIAEAA